MAARKPDPGRAARQAQAQALRQRVALWSELDKELGRLIQQTLAAVVAQLAGAPSDYQQWVLPRLTQSLQRLADELALGLASQSSTGLRRAWTLGDQAVTGSLAAAAEAERQLQTGLAPAAVPTLALGQPDLRQLRALQAVNTHQISGATADLVKSVNRELAQVVLGAQTPHQAMQAVQAKLPERTHSQVRGIVTTNLGTAFNTAAFQALQAQAARDPKIKKQWRRSGKLHSRWNHDLADGQVQPVDRPFVLQAAHGSGTVSLMYPADPAAPVGEVIHCGCVALPWKEGWKMSVPAARPFTAAERAARKETEAQRAGKRLPRRPASGRKTG